MNNSFKRQFPGACQYGVTQRNTSVFRQFHKRAYPAWRLMAPETPCGISSHQGIIFLFHGLTMTSTFCVSKLPSTMVICRAFSLLKVFSMFSTNLFYFNFRIKFYQDMNLNFTTFFINDLSALAWFSIGSQPSEESTMIKRYAENVFRIALYQITLGERLPYSVGISTNRFDDRVFFIWKQ